MGLYPTFDFFSNKTGEEVTTEVTVEVTSMNNPREEQQLAGSFMDRTIETLNDSSYEESREVYELIEDDEGYPPHPLAVKLWEDSTANDYFIVISWS